LRRIEKSYLYPSQYYFSKSITTILDDEFLLDLILKIDFDIKNQ
jgi:hypothetical protein